MRVLCAKSLLCGLSLLSFSACARDTVPLGTEDNTAGGNTNNTGDDGSDDAGDSKPMVDSGTSNTNGNNNGKVDSGPMMQKDAGPGPGMCVPATCAAAMEGGQIESDVDGAPVTIQGKGHAFVKVSAIDGQSAGNSAGGIRATLNSTGGNYDLYAYGGPLDACSDLSISSTNPAGQADSVAPIWGVNGPVVDVSWTLTFEIRPTPGQCDDGWTLNLEGNPCAMPFAPSVPKQCP